MKRPQIFQLSIDLDPEILEPLGQMQRACLLVAGAVALVVLLAWVVPSLARRMPYGWNVTQANTALLLLLSAVSLWLSMPKRSHRQRLTSQMLSVLVAVLSGATLVEYFFHIPMSIDRLLPVRWYSLTPGRMAPQTAMSFVLLGVVLFLLRKRKNAESLVGDGAVFLLCVMALLNGAGYLYGAIRLYGLSGETRTAPATLICLMLLTFVAFGRRAEHGFYGILLGTGIASRTARIAFPVTLAIPFALEAARIVFVKSGWMAQDYAAAVITALEVPLAMGLILFLAWYVNSLEKEIRELSLRDELTQLYNRRGFYLFAERSLRLAQRSRTTFSVLYLDLDGLKHINDTLGHEVGSEFIQNVAELLRQQVRDSDIIGRIGGDEFVIAGEMNNKVAAEMSARLEKAAKERNEQGGLAYPFAFSVGLVSWQESVPETLDEMLHRADVAMYLKKRAK